MLCCLLTATWWIELSAVKCCSLCSTALSSKFRVFAIVPMTYHGQISNILPEIPWLRNHIQLYNSGVVNCVLPNTLLKIHYTPPVLMPLVIPVWKVTDKISCSPFTLCPILWLMNGRGSQLIMLIMRHNRHKQGAWFDVLSLHLLSPFTSEKLMKLIWNTAPNLLLFFCSKLKHWRHLWLILKWALDHAISII